MLGNPRKAIIKLSIPMIIAMSVQTVYNLADAAWVGGLENGGDALAAIGLFFPFFWTVLYADDYLVKESEKFLRNQYDQQKYFLWSCFVLCGQF